MTETVSRSYGGGAGDDEDQALLERMAKREERRQRRMKEALERQRQQEPEGGESVAAEKNNTEEDRPSSWRRARYRDGEEAEEKGEEEEVAPAGGGEAEEQQVGAVEDNSRGSYMRDPVSHRRRDACFYRKPPKEFKLEASYGGLVAPRRTSPSDWLCERAAVPLLVGEGASRAHSETAGEALASEASGDDGVGLRAA